MAINDGRKACINADANSLLALIRQIKTLYDGDVVHSGDLAIFKSFGELLEYADTSGGKDLKSIINVCMQTGFDRLIRYIDIASRTNEKDADVIITSCHKAKGREWPRVRIAGDFSVMSKEGRVISEEVRLIYVAMTRAESELDISELEMPLAA